MLNIYILSDIYNGYWISFLDIIAILSIVSGIFIIITKNPIVSVLFLILLFSSISCYLIFIGIKFILMLINIRVSELISDTNSNIPLAIITIIAFFIPFSNVLPDTKTSFDLNKLLDNVNNNQVSYVTSNTWDGTIVDITDIMSIGNIMYTSYSIWLIITSIILLLAMVGSIVITIKQKI